MSTRFAGQVQPRLASASVSHCLVVSAEKKTKTDVKGKAEAETRRRARDGFKADSGNHTNSEGTFYRWRVSSGRFYPVGRANR
ncbi:hypothetical protein CPLU01_04342 [Colletotrichum plurivorum]|uniref:Uncharacterized protein n=1 Tax=Colletotrichum plurivorum TaxID=2175906 RepID=A0A8H6NK56_9PEZI|nr:hypothetical protein CPLU01_04342 [Colletotrichum plurivorum]